VLLVGERHCGSPILRIRSCDAAQGTHKPPASPRGEQERLNAMLSGRTSRSFPRFESYRAEQGWVERSLAVAMGFVDQIGQESDLIALPIYGSPLWIRSSRPSVGTAANGAAETIQMQLCIMAKYSRFA
jgi:hypothetical protein